MNRFNGKNILCIYYQFPPIKGIGTLRNTKFYTSLKKISRKVIVMTTDNRDFMPDDEYCIDEGDVIDLPTYDFRTIHHKVFGSKGSMIPNNKYSPVKKILMNLINVSPFQNLFGEGGMRFIRQGIKRGRKLIEEEGIDTVFSSYRPISTHLIARQLKKEFPHLYWVADYRDVSPDPMRAVYFNSFTRKAHKRLLKYADEVTTVSQGLKKNLKLYHDRVSVIRNGYESRLLNSDAQDHNSFFTLSYTGIVYENTQKAELLFKAIRELIDESFIEEESIRFIHAGKDISYWRSESLKYKLNNIIINKGLVPRKEAIEIQRSSDINVLLSWASKELKGIVTGKIYEYLAARKPILTIINGIHDTEIEKVINGSGEVFYHDESELDKIKKYILKQYNKWQAGNSGLSKHSSILQYSWEYQFNQWNESLKIEHKNSDVLSNGQ